MSAQIHPLAVVDPGAALGDGVRVGPFAVVGPEVEIGADTEVGAGAKIYGPAKIGRGNRIYSHACLGFDPQDLKFAGERVTVEIGDRNTFREGCTVHRGTAKGGGVTRVGSDNLFMTYTHIAHDCQVGSRTVFANNATLAGHVEVHDDASISAFTSVHQFCRVGRHAYVGGYSVITMDALPFVKTVGIKPAFYGVNKIGLSRKGVAPETIRRLERALRLLVRSGLNTAQALAKIREELGAPPDPDIEYLISFIESAKRGVHKSAPRGGRTGGGESGDGD
jgi:UDP-N-acetylglucosamine acyltransferase